MPLLACPAVNAKNPGKTLLDKPAVAHNAISGLRQYCVEVVVEYKFRPMLFLGKQFYKVLVNEKAVPAMMGVYQAKTHHGGTANGQSKEARPPAKAGQVVDRLDAGVSHTGRFQASAKCVETKKTYLSIMRDA